MLQTLAFRRGDVGFRHTSYCYTPQVWQVLSVLEHPLLQYNPLGEVSRRRLFSICFVSVLRFRHAMLPFTQAGIFSALLKPSLLHTLASRQGGVDRYNEAVFAYKAKKPLHIGVRTGLYDFISLSVCLLSLIHI